MIAIKRVFCFSVCNLLQYQIKTFSCACLSWVLVTNLSLNSPINFDVHFILIHSKTVSVSLPHLLFPTILHIKLQSWKRAIDILWTVQESNNMSDKTIKGLQLGDIMVTNCQSLDVLYLTYCQLLRSLLSSENFFT